MNDAQRQIFNQRITEYFNILDRMSAGEDVLMDKSLQIWGNNLYRRCRYALLGTNKNNSLPEEHVRALEKMLSERYITLESFMEISGNISELVRLIKENSISDLADQNRRLIADRDSFIDAIKANYEKKLSEELESMSSKYERVLADKDRKFSEELSKYDKVIAAKDRKFREYKDNVQDKFAEQERIIFDRSHELYEQQKALVVDLLCSNDVVSLDDIRNLFKSKDMTLDNISSIIKDIRCEIPGLVRNMDNGEFVFSIDSNSIRTCNEYKGWDLSPKISNVHDGVIRFVVRSDLHFGLLSSLDDMKRAFYSHMDFCSKSGNIPIIDLGDICDTTIGKVSIDDWRSIDKDVVKKAYEFYKNYALAISSASNINNFVLFGNHDIHPYLCGLDPLEIIEGYSDNFKFLGVTNGSFRLGYDKVGVFHDAKMVPYIATIDKFKIKQYVCDCLREEIKSISSDYIYSLFGHYHFGTINPECGFAVVDSGLDGSLLFDAYVSDGHVDRMVVTPLQYIDGKIYKSYEIEIYNRGKSFTK